MFYNLVEIFKVTPKDVAKFITTSNIIISVNDCLLVADNKYIHYFKCPTNKEGYKFYKMVEHLMVNKLLWAENHQKYLSKRTKYMNKKEGKKRLYKWLA
jgi:hypothetical protein